MNTHQRLLAHLLPPVLLIGVLALSHLSLSWPRPQDPDGKDASESYGFSVPASEEQRLRLIPTYSRILRVEYDTAKTLRAERRNLPLGAAARDIEWKYQWYAGCYNAAARIYPEALAVGMPLRIPTASFPPD